MKDSKMTAVLSSAIHPAEKALRRRINMDILINPVEEVEAFCLESIYEDVPALKEHCMQAQVEKGWEAVSVLQ